MGKEQQLKAIARAQHGPFSHEQAIDAELTPAMIRWRLDSGLWVRLHNRVYCDPALPPSFERDISAAVLACRDGAAASHCSAAKLWGRDVPLGPEPEVTVCAPSHIRSPDIRVHYTTRLTRTEAAPRDGVRVTSPARTLLDIADEVDPKVLELTLDNFWRRKLVAPTRLMTYLEDEWCMARRGSAQLRRLVAERAGQRPAGSDLETQLFQLIRETKLPLPTRQYPVVTPFGPRYLDLAYPARKVAIELDGRESRFDPDVFLDERVRQNLIEAQGWTFRRFGYAHVTGEPLWTVFTVAEAIGAFPTRWSLR